MSKNRKPTGGREDARNTGCPPVPPENATIKE